MTKNKRKKAIKVVHASNYGTQWTDSKSDPIEDIKKGMDILGKSTIRPFVYIVTKAEFKWMKKKMKELYES